MSVCVWRGGFHRDSQSPGAPAPPITPIGSPNQTACGAVGCRGVENGWGGRGALGCCCRKPGPQARSRWQREPRQEQAPSPCLLPFSSSLIRWCREVRALSILALSSVSFLGPPLPSSSVFTLESTCLSRSSILLCSRSLRLLVWLEELSRLYCCGGARAGKPQRYAQSGDRAGRLAALSPQGDCGGGLAGSSGERPSAARGGPARQQRRARRGWRCLAGSGVGWARAKGSASRRGNGGARGPRDFPGGF